MNDTDLNKMINIANEAGITLIGFSREQRHVAYANIHRLKK